MEIAREFFIYSNSYKHNVLKILHFLSQEFSSYLPVKSRLFFNIFRISKIQNANFWVLYLRKHEHIGKILIYISAPLKDFNSGVFLDFCVTTLNFLIYPWTRFLIRSLNKAPLLIFYINFWDGAFYIRFKVPWQGTF